MSDTKLREKADALIAFTQQGPRFIAWVEAVTDSIAPEPEKVAKVETMADRIAADLKAGTFRGEQPAPPEPAAREMPEAVRKAIQDLHDWADTYESDLLPREIAYTRSVADALETFWRAHHAQPVAVWMTEELERVLEFASLRARILRDSHQGDSVAFGERMIAAIAAVRAQAASAQPKAVPVEAIPVGIWQLEDLLKYADLAEVALRTGFHPPEFLFTPADRSLRQSIDAVKEQRDRWLAQVEKGTA